MLNGFSLAPLLMVLGALLIVVALWRLWRLCISSRRAAQQAAEAARAEDSTPEQDR